MIEKRECLRKKTGSLYDIHRALPVVDPENQLVGGGGGGGGAAAWAYYVQLTYSV